MPFGSTIRFNLSIRDVEDLLAERNINVSYESIRLWVNKFGPEFAHRLKRKHQGFGDTYYLDEVFVKIGGKQHYLWRAVDQDGEVIDVYFCKNEEMPRQPNVSSNVFLNRAVYLEKSSPTNYGAMAKPDNRRLYFGYSYFRLRSLTDIY